MLDLTAFRARMEPALTRLERFRSSANRARILMNVFLFVGFVIFFLIFGCDHSIGSDGHTHVAMIKPWCFVLFFFGWPFLLLGFAVLTSRLADGLGYRERYREEYLSPLLSLVFREARTAEASPSLPDTSGPVPEFWRARLGADFWPGTDSSQSWSKVQSECVVGRTKASSAEVVLSQLYTYSSGRGFKRSYRPTCLLFAWSKAGAAAEEVTHCEKSGDGADRLQSPLAVCRRPDGAWAATPLSFDLFEASLKETISDVALMYGRYQALFWLTRRLEEVGGKTESVESPGPSGHRSVAVDDSASLSADLAVALPE
jgi:hypothetical protein